MSETTVNGNGATLTRLLERQKELEARLAQEKLRLAKRKQKNDKKLGTLLGRGVSAAAERSPEFHLMLKQTLSGLGEIFTESELRFLKSQNWELL